MKRFPIVLLAVLFSGTGHLRAEPPPATASMLGAWRIAGAVERVMIVTPTDWSQTIYDIDRKKFIRTFGGSYTTAGDVVSGRMEFDSEDPQRVGGSFHVTIAWRGDDLSVIQDDGTEERWTRIDAGRSALAGTWRITGRQVDGAFQEMPLRARRTLKLLSGTRFQWVAINVETGEFSGTGGGTYTFENGKYTEHIEFFSRDGSRVGARLEFEGEVKGETWRHRGRSSKGDPIDEEWTRFTPKAETRTTNSESKAMSPARSE